MGPASEEKGREKKGKERALGERKKSGKGRGSGWGST